MHAAQLYIRNARVVTEAADFRGGVLVEHGRISRLVEGDPELSAGEVVDAGGLALLPGLIDGHVHFSEPGRGHWEGFYTGSRAAAAGGVTTFVEMPLNASPPTVNAEALRLKLDAVRTSIVDYALWGGLVDDNVADLDDLQVGGVAGFKAFMCASSTDFPRVDEDVMRRGMSAIGRMKSFLAVHAETEDITSTLAQDLQLRGRTDRRAWGLVRPIAAELDAIDAAIAAAHATQCRLHLVHVSSAAGIDRILDAKRRGQPVTAETCPHYLFFTEDDLVSLGPVAKWLLRCGRPLSASGYGSAFWEVMSTSSLRTIRHAFGRKRPQGGPRHFQGMGWHFGAAVQPACAFN